ncbi:MAG: DNA primase [Phycisphaerae bacterium]
MSLADRETITRQIRDAIDIVDLVGSSVSLRRAGSTFKGLCPFHEEKTPSFIVNPARQIFKCFGCGVGGDVFKFVQLRENVDFLEARRILAERAGINLDPQPRSGPSGPAKTDLARACDWARQVFRKNYQGPSGQAAREYVAKRGISAEMAEAFALGLAVDSYDSLIRQAGLARIDHKLLLAAGLVKESQHGGYYDTFRNRLMFPIVDTTGRVLGFGGRTLGEDPAKYLNTPATPLFDKGTNLFGLDRARQAIGEAGRAIVVEGYTDCIMAHQYGFCETVATLGTAMTEAHARLLRRFTDRVILLFDSDEAGQRAADRALAVTVTVGLDVSLARVPEGKDPCDYLLSAGQAAFRGVLNQAVGALEFKWREVSRRYGVGATGPARRRAVEEYLQQLSAWLGQGAIDPIQTGLLINQLSQIVSLPAEDLFQQVRRLSQRSRSLTPFRGKPGRPQPQPTFAQKGSNSQQEALRQIVEVLLNEPAYYVHVASWLKPEHVWDPALSAIVAEMVAILNSGERLQVADLIGRFESPEFGRLITDLQDHGERRGQFASVIEGAIACLESFERSRHAAVLAEDIRRSRQQAGDRQVPENEDERLRALTDAARQSHFSPVRARKRLLDLP